MNIEERTQQQVIREVKELAEEMAEFLESKAKDIRLAMLLMREIDEADNHSDNIQACEQICSIVADISESRLLALDAEAMKIAAGLFKAWDAKREIRG